MRVPLRSPFVVAIVTGVVLVAAAIQPANELVAAPIQQTVALEMTVNRNAAATTGCTPTPSDSSCPAPDLVVSSVETVGQPQDPCQDIRNELKDLSPGDFMNFRDYQRARAELGQQLLACENAGGGVVTPSCSAGLITTFTIHVRNTGVLPTSGPAEVLLIIDGVSAAVTTVDAFAPNADNTVAISGIVLVSGTHVFSVIVNPAHNILETDFSNNTFSRNNLSCV